MPVRSVASVRALPAWPPSPRHGVPVAFETIADTGVMVAAMV